MWRPNWKRKAWMISFLALSTRSSRQRVHLGSRGRQGQHSLVVLALPHRKDDDGIHDHGGAVQTVRCVDLSEGECE